MSKKNKIHEYFKIFFVFFHKFFFFEFFLLKIYVFLQIIYLVFNIQPLFKQLIYMRAQHLILFQTSLKKNSNVTKIKQI